MFKKVIEKLENKSFDFKLFAITFLSIVILRSLLENFAVLSIGNFNFFFQWTAGLVHFPLWFLNVFIWTAIIMRVFTKEDMVKIAKIQLFFLPMILLPVIIDLAATFGKGKELTYLYPENFGDLIYQTSHFFFNDNISAGLRIEIFIISSLIAIFTYTKTKRILKSIGSSLVFYASLIAIHGSLPGLIFILEKAIGRYGSIVNIKNFYGESLLNDDNIAVGRGYISSYQPPWESIYGIFNLTTALFIFISLIIGLLVFFYLWNKDKFFSFLKNMRPERLAHYLLMAVTGIIIAFITFKQLPPFSIFNILSLATLLLTISAFWMFAVGLNDMNDIECDRISNPARPLVKGKLDIADVKNINIALFLLSIWGASILGYRILLFVLSAHAISFLYSSPPFKLKNLPIVNSFLISAASLLFTMAGFFMISPTLELSDFPKKFALLIIICYTLGANFKDIKDIGGDMAEKTYTIPVIFGAKLGKIIIGIFVFLSIIIVPMILGQYQLIPLSLIFGISAFLAIIKKRYREKLVFGLYLFYILILIILFALDFIR